MPKKSKMTTREKLVSNIVFYSDDELEKEDYINIATESEDQLLDRLISILDYYAANQRD